MSTAKEATRDKGNYLQHVELKNYKSISDLSVDFKPGLNIIIGKNGSGKTNFVNCLNTVLTFDLLNFLDVEGDVKLSINNKDVSIGFKPNNKENDFYEKYIDLYSKPLLRIELNKKDIIIEDPDIIHRSLIDNNTYFFSNLIGHGIPYNQAELISIPTSFELIKNGAVSYKLAFSKKRTHFMRRFILKLFAHISNLLNENRKLDRLELKQNIINFSVDVLYNINDDLSRISPIKEVRINPNFSFIEEDNGERMSISNFYFDYCINDTWYPFDLLSDGTKRLFYLISEIIGVDQGKKTASQLDIILIEEPELGIHPHQLHLLMLFVKEQARDKQIILTTHSPQVLDVLSPDELDRIIICEYDQQKGTQLRHLTEKQVKKAQRYMKEDFLSDYWRFSDLEPTTC